MDLDPESGATVSDQTVRRWVPVLWPSFLTACCAEVIFFSLMDPVEFVVFGTYIPPDRSAAYTVGFFAFWMLAAGSSAITAWLVRGAAGAGRDASVPPRRV
jgi:hypothetical protein